MRKQLHRRVRGGERRTRYVLEHLSTLGDFLVDTHKDGSTMGFRVFRPVFTPIEATSP